MNLSVIDRDFSVKMARYWPSSFRVSMNRDEAQGNEHAKGQYSALLTKQAWSRKYLFYGQTELSLAGPTREIPSGQHGPLLAVRVAHHNTGFALP